MGGIFLLILVIGIIVFFNGGIDQSIHKLGFEKSPSHIVKHDTSRWDEMTANTEYKIVGDTIVLKSEVCENKKNWIKKVASPSYYTNGITFDVLDTDGFKLDSFKLQYKEFTKENDTCYLFNGTKKFNNPNKDLIATARKVTASGAHVR